MSNDRTKKYEPGDPVEVIQGQYKGRTGRFIKYCSSVFPEYCRVTLDLKGRQRVNQTIMVEHKHLQTLANATDSTIHPDVDNSNSTGIQLDEGN